jgi:hypothetical protein
MFPPSSRYHETEVAKLELPGGREVVYLRRRFPPPAGASALLAEHAVTQGERLDNVTARYLADPEQFWRVCDANDAERPDELTERADRRLRIPLP